MNKCISCDNLLGEQLCLIGKQYPSAIYSVNNNSNMATSLDLTMCSSEACKLVQLNEVVSLDYVYKHYPYQTSTTATMRALLSDLVQDALSKVNIKSGDVILDIGGNDGTLLSNFLGSGAQLLNIDIANGIEQIIKDDSYTYINAKFTEHAYLGTQLKPPRLIFSSAVFYQLPDPSTFCTDLWKIMDNDTIFFLQMSYLGSMYKNNVYDNVVHEHLGYYSLYSLGSLLERNRLKIIDVSVNEVYGGSLRVAIVKESSKIEVNLENLNYLKNSEESNKVNEIESLLNFAFNFNEWKSSARKLLENLVQKYNFVVGLGASTKGNMLLQSLQIDNLIMKYIIDNNEKKIGTWTSGSQIPIVNESYLINPHKAMFLLPYYYVEFFENLLGRYIYKGDFVELFIPLPYPKVIKVWGNK